MTIVAVLASPAFAQQPPPEGLTLERAIQLAQERNVRGLTAEQRVQVAEARVASARAAFLPSLSLTAQYTRRERDRVTTSGGAQIIVQSRNALRGDAVARMTLLDASNFPLYAAAAHERDATALEARDELRLTAFDAAQAFVAALSGEQVVSAAERRLQLAKDTQRDAQSRFAAQLVSSNDVTRANLEVATAERELVRARGERDTAYVTLGYVIAEEKVEKLVSPEGMLAVVAEAELKEDLLARARGNRLDLQAQRERVESLRSSALEPLMRLIPTLAASATYSLTNEPGLAQDFDNASASLVLAWQIFDGGERYAVRRERLALAKIAELEAVDLERQLSADVRSAIVQVTSAQAGLKQAEVAAAAADQNAKESSILYRQGLASALEVSAAGVQLFDAQVALTRERLGLALAFFDLRAALGLDPLGRDTQK